MKVRREIYDTYWRFAAERQEIFYKRQKGETPPYTMDPILGRFKFCNVYRATDRVSQFLIKEVIYSEKRTELDTLLRIFLFRLLNKNQTWIRLEQEVGEIRVKTFNRAEYSRALEKLRSEGEAIYGNAFILCANKSFGYDRKHDNHLALIEKVFVKEGSGLKISKTRSLKGVFNELKNLPLIGDFMAYQIAIDFNYSEVFCFDEDDFTRAGPGAMRGIQKCFEDTSGRDPGEIIRFMVENQEKEFNRLGLKFRSLGGRRLKAIDCQGLFCEVDKYCRVKFPDLKSSRKRIKNKFVVTKEPIQYFFPPKWRLASPVF